MKSTGSTFNEVNSFRPRLGHGPIDIAGALASVVVKSDLEFWDLSKRSKVATMPLDAVDTFASYDESIVVVGKNSATGRGQLTTMTSGQATVTHESKALMPWAGFVEATERELYFFHGETVSLLKLPELELADLVSEEWPIEGSARFGEGVVYIAGNAILVTLDRSMKPTRYRPNVGVAGLMHVATAGPEQVWVSTQDKVHLLKLKDGKVTMLHCLALPGIYHMAGAGSDLAVLTVDMQRGSWQKLTLTMVSADGAVRWSRELPVPAKEMRTAVAASAEYVAVVADDKLSAWSAKDGTPVTLQE